MKTEQELTIVPERHEVFVKGERVNVTPKEFTILSALKSTNRTLNREELAAIGWPDQDVFDVDLRTVDQHIARLRRKIGQSYIETVPKYGYRIAA